MAPMRRLVWLALLGGAAYLAWTLRRPGRPQPAPAARPPARPVAAAEAAAPAATVDRETTQTAGGQAWVEPDADGACPLSHPVKANRSGIFHVAGGRFYERARAERCYADPDAAEADGYRQSKS